MEVKKAAEIISSYEDAKKTLLDEEARKKQAELKSQIDEVERLIAGENFAEARRKLNQISLGQDAKLDWQKKINEVEDGVIKRTLPERLLPAGLPCQNCGKWCALTDECILDNNNVILIGFCQKCSKRTVMRIARVRFKNVHPIEKFLQPLLKEGI